MQINPNAYNMFDILLQGKHSNCVSTHI